MSIYSFLLVQLILTYVIQCLCYSELRLFKKILKTLLSAEWGPTCSLFSIYRILTRYFISLPLWPDELICVFQRTSCTYVHDGQDVRGEGSLERPGKSKILRDVEPHQAKKGQAWEASESPFMTAISAIQKQKYRSWRKKCWQPQMTTPFIQHRAEGGDQSRCDPYFHQADS